LEAELGIPWEGLIGLKWFVTITAELVQHLRVDNVRKWRTSEDKFPRPDVACGYYTSSTLRRTPVRPEGVGRSEKAWLTFTGL